MAEQSTNGNVKLRVFIWAMSVVIFLFGIGFTVISAMAQKTQANELKINAVEITEQLHYTIIKESLDDIKEALNIK